mgnify:CR=1 FL=1
MSRQELKLKLSRFFNKINHKNIKKRSRGKRRIFASVILIGNILFGNLVTNDLKNKKYGNATPLTQEKVISVQEFDSLENSCNSGQTVRTRNGSILILVRGGVLPGADAFPLPSVQRTRGRTTTAMNGQNPGGGGGGGGGNPNIGSGSKPGSKPGSRPGGCSSNPTPRFPHHSSPNNKKKRKKNNIDVKIIDGQLILRVIIDDMPFYIDETTVRKKIYHAPDFDVALPDNLDLEYVQSLSTKDRLKYLSDTDVLPQKCVGEYMKKLGQHLLDPTTEIKVGTLGKNGTNKGWNEAIPGTHAFNPRTKNDVFFAHEGFKYGTGMKLNDGQRVDLQDNNNIL